MGMDEETKKNDHDLLIEIKTIVKGLVTDVKDIKTNTVHRVETLELTCASRTELGEVQKQVDRLRMWQNWLTGVTTVVSGLGSFLAVALWNHLTGK